MKSAAEARSKTFTWTAPLSVLQAGAGMSGLEYLTALRDGHLPRTPMAALMNLELREVERGRVRFICTPGEEHYNPLGSVHGGLMCSALDTAAGCAAHTTLAAGVGYTSIEIKVSFMRPVTVDTGILTTTGTVTKEGRRVIFADAVVQDAMGRTVAAGSSSLLVIPGDPPAATNG